MPDLQTTNPAHRPDLETTNPAHRLDVNRSMSQPYWHADIYTERHQDVDIHTDRQTHRLVHTHRDLDIHTDRDTQSCLQTSSRELEATTGVAMHNLDEEHS